MAAVAIAACMSLPAFFITAAMFDAAAMSTPLFLGRFKDWTIWEFQGNEHRICYMVTGLRDIGGSSNPWPALLVTVKPGQDTVNEVSVRSKKIASHDGIIRAEIGERRFPLFKKSEHAWLDGDVEAERKLLEAMRQGQAMTVRGVSGKSRFAESFSLIGFTKAEEAMPDICALSVNRT